jgi:hypothetical protein
VNGYLALALMFNRIMKPEELLVETQWWERQSLPHELGLGSVGADDLYQAMDWLYQRRQAIEKRLLSKRLYYGQTALFELVKPSLEWRRPEGGFEWFTRASDGVTDIERVSCGVLADVDGRPLSLKIFDENRPDAAEYCPILESIISKYDLERVIVMGTAEMLNDKNIDIIKNIKILILLPS